MQKSSSMLPRVLFIGILLAGVLLFGCTSPATQYVCPDGSIKLDPSECGGQVSCTPDWQCSAWVNCSSEGKQTRDCTDKNDCGVTTGEPDTAQLCTPACTPSWICSGWSVCASNGTQARICSDKNDCGVTTGEPPESQVCTPSCAPSWSCTEWSSCSSSGEQTRTCTDTNDCGVTTGKPPVLQDCTPNNVGATEYAFQYYDNKEPYYSSFCDKINPYNLNVREAAANAIRNDPGSYNFNQLLDVYDWVKKNIIYQTSPLAGIPYPPEQTLATGSGDCKNQAVLIDSMIEAIGGTAKVVADPSCTHAYTIVYFGSAGRDLSSFTQAVANHYGSKVLVNHFTINDEVWVIFDPAGGSYPGDTLPECYGNRTLYYITSCLSCVNQYPNMPYTYGDKCYSQCPSGTVHRNDYACYSCDPGYWSFNNECVTCPSGDYLATDGLCYPE